MKFYILLGVCAASIVISTNAIILPEDTSTSTTTSSSTTEMKTCMYQGRFRLFRVTEEVCDWNCQQILPDANGACVKDICQCPMQTSDDSDPYFIYGDIE